MRGMRCFSARGRPAARLCLPAVLASSTLLTAGMAAAQAPPPPPVAQKGGTFFEPPADVPAIYLPLPRSSSSPAGPEHDQPPLSLRLSADFPLRHGTTSGFGSQGPTGGSPTVQADLRYTPWRDAGWFAQATFYRYLRPSRQQPWNPDFTYSFGYETPGPDTFSLVYANYSGTRWSADRSGARRANFDQGQWTLAYKFGLPPELEPYLLTGDGDEAACSAGVHYTPRYADVTSQSLRRNGAALSMGCRYTRREGWYAALTLFAYPQRSRQQPWDPDFTYSLGFFDWRPGTVSVQYSNYSGNRFPGRTRAAGEGLLRSGSLSISWRVPL